MKLSEEVENLKQQVQDLETSKLGMGADMVRDEVVQLCGLTKRLSEAVESIYKYLKTRDLRELSPEPGEGGPHA